MTHTPSGFPTNSRPIPNYVNRMKAHRRRMRRQTAGAVALFAVLCVGLVALSLFTGGWAIMLVFGILHSIFPEVPAIGYWSAVGLMAGVTLIRLFVWGGMRRGGD